MKKKSDTRKLTANDKLLKRDAPKNYPMSYSKIYDNYKLYVYQTVCYHVCEFYPVAQEEILLAIEEGI